MRSEFEEWYTRTNQSNINDSCWCIGGFYTDRVVQRSWEAWQAAKADAVPDGFVVVPKEPTEEMLNALNSGFQPDYEGGSFDAESAYKTMIEAGEKK